MKIIDFFGEVSKQIIVFGENVYVFEEFIIEVLKYFGREGVNRLVFFGCFQYVFLFLGVEKMIILGLDMFVWRLGYFWGFCSQL